MYNVRFRTFDGGNAEDHVGAVASNGSMVVWAESIVEAILLVESELKGFCGDDIRILEAEEVKSMSELE